MDIHRCRFVDYTPHTITALAFSHASDASKIAPPGLRFAVGRSNGDIEIWNPRYSWLHELTLPGARGRAIEGLVWAHAKGENPRLFSIGGSTYITEWDLKTCRPMTNLNCNAGVAWCIDANTAGTRLAVGCDDGSVVVINISGGSGVMDFEFICQRQDQRVLGIRWYDDNMVIGGCSDGRVRCWSVNGDNKGQLVSSMRVDKLKTESTLVWSIVALPSKQQFVTGDSTGSVKFWDIKTSSLIQTYSVHDADVLTLTKDASEEKVFSAGIDRKIHQFSWLENRTKKNSKWIHNFNRLLHLNDVRSLSLFESKAYNFLVSGGVERSIIVQSVENFLEGPYKKILMDQQLSNIRFNPLFNLVALYQDQMVKIWRLQDDKHKLVAKLSLADEDNITSIDISGLFNAQPILAVSTINSVKVFILEDLESKYKVRKIRDAAFDSVVSGAKSVFFYNDNKLIIQTPQDEIYKFVVVSAESIELEDEIESEATFGKDSRAGIDYCDSIRYIALSKDSSKLAVLRFNNSVELLPLEVTFSPRTLATLSENVHLIEFTENDTLLVLSEENKLLEFNTEESEGGLLSSWSQLNSEVMPLQFLKLEQRPQGMFTQGTKVWIFGSQWVSFFDLSLNFEVAKNYLSKSKKRNNDGLSIREVEETGILKGGEENFVEREMKQALIRRAEKEAEYSGAEGKLSVPFWLTQKYRPILKVGDWGDNEIAVVEREAFALPTSSAFGAPHFKV